MAEVDGSFRALDEKSLVDYIRATPAVSSRIGNGLEGLTVKEVGDGNLNFVYIVINSSGESGGSVVIKQAYKVWILKTIEDTWNLFHKKFICLWNENRDGGEAYLADVYKKPELLLLVQGNYMKDLFHDSLGFGAAKMIRRIVGVAHVEDFESITDASLRAQCEHRALEFAKMLMKERRHFDSIQQIVSSLQNIPS